MNEITFAVGMHVMCCYIGYPMMITALGAVQAVCEWTDDAGESHTSLFNLRDLEAA